MSPRQHLGGLLSATEGLLWLTATLCLGGVVFAVAQGATARSAAQAIHPQPTLVGTATPHPTAAAADGSVIARLEIPSLSLSVPVVTGIDPDSLRHGVGHITGTAMPGGLGTLGLAGHRDTYLRALRDVARGMDIRVVDATGTYHYTVDSTEVVTPEQVGVLNIGSRPELTLITCFPFNYVGAAPRRFIVHAHLNSVDPDAAG